MKFFPLLLALTLFLNAHLFAEDSKPYFSLEPKGSKAPYAVVIQVEPISEVNAHQTHTLCLGILNRKTGHIFRLKETADWPLSDWFLDSHDIQEIQRTAIEDWAYAQPGVRQYGNFTAPLQADTSLLWSNDYHYLLILYHHGFDFYYLYSLKKDGSWQRHHLPNLAAEIDQALKNENSLKQPWPAFYELLNSNVSAYFYDLINNQSNEDNFSPVPLGENFFDANKTNQLHLSFDIDLIPSIYSPAGNGISAIDGHGYPSPYHMSRFEIQVHGILEFHENSPHTTFKKNAVKLEFFQNK